LAPGQVGRARQDVAPRRRVGPRDDEFSFAIREFLGQDRVRARGQGCAAEDANRLARADLACEDPARGHLAHEAQADGAIRGGPDHIRGLYGEAILQGDIDGRRVLRREQIHCDHPAGQPGDGRHFFALQWLDGSQGRGQRFFESDH